MRRHPRRRHRSTARRGGFVHVWLACLLPLIGWLPQRVLYRCQITGELLPVCCCEVEAPRLPAAAVPSCCEDEAPLASADEPLASCDCCDVVFEEGRPRALATLERDAGHGELVFVATLAMDDALAPRVVEGSTIARARWNPPRERPLFELYSVYRC